MPNDNTDIVQLSLPPVVFAMDCYCKLFISNSLLALTQTVAHILAITHGKESDGKGNGAIIQRVYNSKEILTLAKGMVQEKGGM